MSISGGPDIVQDGLVLSLDAADRNSLNASTLAWTDLSGNNITMTLNNPVSASFVNNSVLFSPMSVSSSTGAYYSTNSSLISSLTTELSLECWVNVNQFDLAKTRPVSPRFSEQAEPLGFSLRNGAIDYEINTTTGWQTSIAGSSAIATGRWIYVGQSTSDSVKLFRSYINGSMVSNFTFTGTPNTGGGLLVGRGFYGGIANFFGYVSVVRYYSRALTPEEFLQNYNAQKGRFGL